MRGLARMSPPTLALRPKESKDPERGRSSDSDLGLIKSARHYRRRPDAVQWQARKHGGSLLAAQEAEDEGNPRWLGKEAGWPVKVARRQWPSRRAPDTSWLIVKSSQLFANWYSLFAARSLCVSLATTISTAWDARSSRRRSFVFGDPLLRCLGWDKGGGTQSRRQKKQSRTTVRD